MCGIVSVINTKEENREIAKKIFKSILMANESRGHDSTGVLAIERDTNEFSLFKDTITAKEFLNRKKFRQVEGDIWIGHTRLATTGDVNIRNAHPLQRGNVFLVHNGVINNHVEIGKGLDFEHQVDSEILIPIVEGEDWKLLQEVRGSANFIAWDRSKGLLYIERHSNPLYCLALRDIGIAMFSSVEGVLEFVDSHYGDGKGVFSIDDDTLITLNMKGEMVGKEMKLKFPTEYLPSTRVTTGKTYTSSDYHDGRHSEYYENYEQYSAYSNYDSYSKSVGDIDDEDFLICSVCGSEIDVSEFEEGAQAWGFPLCYSCLTDLEEANDLIKTGGQLDLSSDKWCRFEDILLPYLP